MTDPENDHPPPNSLIHFRIVYEEDGNVYSGIVQGYRPNVYSGLNNRNSYVGYIVLVDSKKKYEGGYGQFEHIKPFVKVVRENFIRSIDGPETTPETRQTRRKSRRSTRRRKSRRRKKMRR